MLFLRRRTRFFSLDIGDTSVRQCAVHTHDTLNIADTGWDDLASRDHLAAGCHAKFSAGLL